MDNPEKLANKRQRKSKGQSKMDNPEKLTNKRQRKRRSNQKWTIQRNWQINVRENEGAIKNGQSRETGK